MKREKFTEQEHFILEAALQLGFNTVDEDCEVYVVSDEDLIDFVATVAKSAIEQALRHKP